MFSNSVPASDEIADPVVVAPASSIELIMRDVGNDVVRLESAEIVPLNTEVMPLLGSCALLEDPLPAHVRDMAIEALRSLGDAAAGYSIAVPAHGFARFLDEGLTEVWIRLVLRC
jgi:hypothetical protein